MTNGTNEHRCLLRHVCKAAGNPDQCTPNCAAFIQLHGASGKGGRVAAANVPADYRLVTLKDSPVRAEQADNYRTFDDYVSTFKRQFGEGADVIKSLYLYSANPGTGKTTSAASLLNEYLIAHYVGSLKRGQQPKQRPAYFLSVNTWQSLYNGFARQGVPRDIAEPKAAEYYRQQERAKHADFAILDDVGVRSMTEAFRSDLHDIIDYRVTNRLPTIYTSNLPISELPQVFGEERLADRIGDRCATIHFKGTSQRGMRK